MNALIRQSMINGGATTGSPVSVDASSTPKRNAWSASCKSPGSGNAYRPQSRQPAREGYNGRPHKTHHCYLGASLSLAPQSLPGELSAPLCLADDTGISRLLPRSLSTGGRQGRTPLLAARTWRLDYQCHRRTFFNTHTATEWANDALQPARVANASSARRNNATYHQRR